jgi:hypothetical protein
MERKVHSGCHGGREATEQWRLRVERMAFRVNPRSRRPETLARPQLGVSRAPRRWMGLSSHLRGASRSLG